MSIGLKSSSKSALMKLMSEGGNKELDLSGTLYGKPQWNKSEAGTESAALGVSLGSLTHMVKSMKDCITAGNMSPMELSARAAIVMGVYEKDFGKKKMENTPSNALDRSMFNCSRYQFFLDAPFDISHLCCSEMKKKPSHEYQKKTGRNPMTAQMATESRLRTQAWLRNGCNGFDMKTPVSNPMAFWTESDVLMFVYLYGEEMLDARKSAYTNEHMDRTQEELEKEFSGEEWRPICSVYGDLVDLREKDQLSGQLTWQDLGLFDLGKPILGTTGAKRTGCMFCGFGCQREKPGEGRFERMRVTHPKVYDYVMRPKDKGGLGYKEVIDWINEHGNLNIRY